MNRFLVLMATLAFSSAATAQSDDRLSAGDVVKDCDDCPELVVIPSGTFLMGTPISDREVDLVRGEGPQVKVTIDYMFAAGRFEVTHGQFEAFVEATGYVVKDECRVWNDDIGFNDDPTASWQDRRQPKRVKDEHPVGCVSWNDAKAYVGWLAEITGKRYRLLSEAEWEYAARAGTTTPRFWGSSSGQACAWANTFDLDGAEEYPFPWFPATCRDGYADLAPVGQFKPNAFGLYDMIGNVWEWTEDCWAATHVGRPRDGSAWKWDVGCDMHTTRGGGWLSAPERNRIAWPGRDPIEKHNTQFGFRVARDLGTGGEVGEGGSIRRMTLFTSDVELSKAFWSDAMGYRVSFEDEEFGGEETAGSLNLDEGNRAHFVMMTSAGGTGPMIGLLGSNGDEFAPIEREGAQRPRAGESLLVVKVADIFATFEKLEAMGVQIASQPSRLSGQMTSVVGYEGTVYTPDGTRINVQQVDSGG
ncbi:MAG: SUMF1/EgtB/PvdO family nonheme iron enzyme [Rhodospirillaceae bacterium]|nr:SUMF1/EgtB/PvdO family nonheme iron enzyme [Rhodospirillaceae bacterium]MBT5564821.1 SUMF1/EgtB/PvdO family nonheme iron enzyme [Rhodospirillaceae bacterium]MBT6089215.1 SUMF1/EgtB/PvdO family nonheme iron enzyme [Rhodospirillaceae bacterium]